MLEAISPKEGTVQVHANAKLVPASRLLLVQRIRQEGWKVTEVATAFGVSERTVYRWLARWRGGDLDWFDHHSSSSLKNRCRTLGYPQELST